MGLPIEFEFNPFSTASRAARAENAGRIGEALRLYVKAGQYERVLRCLSEALPDWPVRSSLVAAARELLALEESSAIARAAGVPETITNRLAQEAQTAGDAIWRSADRVAASAAQKIGSTRLQQGLKREDEALARLRRSIQAAREGLAELTLSGEGGMDLETEDMRLRQLAQTTRELTEVLDESATY